MNKTNQYQLNQWESTDRILREDFNRDNLNLENALAELDLAVTTEVAAREQAVADEITAREQAVSAEAAAREQAVAAEIAAREAAVAAETSARKKAVTAAQNAASEAVAAAKSEASAAVSAEATARAKAITNAVNQINSAKADKTELSALSTVVNALPMVKLKSVTVSSAATQVNVDVSDIKLHDYAYWLIIPSLSAGASNIGLRLNNHTSNYQFNGSQGAYMLQFSGAAEESSSGGVGTHLNLMTYGSNHHMVCLGAFAKYGKFNDVAGYLKNTYVTSSTLTSLNFIAVTSGTTIAKGGKISIYGVKW